MDKKKKATEKSFEVTQGLKNRKLFIPINQSTQFHGS